MKESTFLSARINWRGFYMIVGGGDLDLNGGFMSLSNLGFSLHNILYLFNKMETCTVSV